MEAKTNGRIHRSTSEWKSLVSRYEASGRSRAAFCRAEEISRSTFDLWFRKLRAEKPTPARRTAEFVEVTPTAEHAFGWTVEIELPDGTLARLRG